MARVGLSKPYVALYENNNGVVTYSGGAKIAKAIETHVSPNSGGDNTLFADNGLAESDKQFSGATLSAITDELPLDSAGLMFGLTVEDVTIEGVSGATGKKITFSGAQDIPYLGYGVVVKKIVNNVTSFMALILRKVQFSNPGDDYVTQGESISWQTPSLEATVMRDDTPEQSWRDWVEWDTEAHAEAYIKQVLNISDTPEG